MSARAQLYIAISLLLVLGLGVTLYKNRVLGFPLPPGAVVTVWTAESRSGRRSGMVGILQVLGSCYTS